MAEFEKCADAECDHFQRRQRHAHPMGTAERRQKIDHADAWNVANHRKNESNLARAYIELRDVAWGCVLHPAILSRRSSLDWEGMGINV